MNSMRLTKAAILVAAGALISGSAIGNFWDPNLANGATRTEFASGYGTSGGYISLWYVGNGLPGIEGCQWNSIDSFAGCPGRTGLGPRSDGKPVWAGTLQARDACGGDPTRVGDSWKGCLTYGANTYFSLNNPGANYWVVHANNDPSFDQCRRGPPGISQTIIDPIALPTTPNLYKVAMETNATGRKTMNVIVVASENDFNCPQLGGLQYTIPYLSVGAHSNRGNGQAIGYVYPVGNTGADILHFTAQVRGYIAPGCKVGTGSICFPTTPGVHAGIAVSSNWSGIRRMVFLDLYSEGSTNSSAHPVHSKWNWPLSDSMFWPGADIVTLTASTLNRDCGYSVPSLAIGSPGPQQTYAISMSKLFRCASDLGLFTAPMPFQYTAVEAVDWFVESSGTAGMFWLGVQDPVVSGT